MRRNMRIEILKIIKLGQEHANNILTHYVSGKCIRLHELRDAVLINSPRNRANTLKKNMLFVPSRNLNVE
jgi:hypothetical protein